MLRILKGIYLEKGYPGVYLGVVVGTEEREAVLIDAPLRSEEAREWLGQVEEKWQPRFAVLLDAHPDRALGIRHYGLPAVAHADTSAEMVEWPDVYKGGVRPVGGEADSMKRVSGVSESVPEVIFRDQMMIELPGRPIRLLHRPGPTAGAMWVEIPDKETVFIGDAVTVKEPPYVGAADVEAWLHSLDVLRDSPFDEYKVISSRDGLIERDDINDMARFLRKIPVRIERLEERENPDTAARRIASELIEDFKVTKARRDLVLLRLEMGLVRLLRAEEPAEE